MLYEQVAVKNLDKGMMLDLENDSVVDPAHEVFIYHGWLAEVVSTEPDEENGKIIVKVRTDVNELHLEFPPEHLVKVLEEV